MGKERAVCTRQAEYFLALCVVPQPQKGSSSLDCVVRVPRLEVIPAMLARSDVFQTQLSLPLRVGQSIQPIMSSWKPFVLVARTIGPDEN
jgi:hypothetical protein